ncbi:hypothetical protein GIB67_007870 [Kingdonia uniflora]|uniref:Uncharacterized protein n=1 Tax=Kingdonia uniflora TaxID=39325 RepID=A0A7J7PAN7_9MAGN|nr:hypothetical protein GIB67_007870 [Kingdonia uniflora]
MGLTIGEELGVGSISITISMIELKGDGEEESEYWEQPNGLRYCPYFVFTEDYSNTSLLEHLIKCLYHHAAVIEALPIFAQLRDMGFTPSLQDGNFEERYNLLREFLQSGFALDVIALTKLISRKFFAGYAGIEWETIFFDYLMI